MKFLGRTEVAEFMGRHEVGKFESTIIPLTYKLPLEFGRLLSSMRLVLQAKPYGEWSLAIIESAGIWPSWEDRNLYNMIRNSKGGSIEWSYGEGHLFGAHEIADLITFVTVFANFRWDFRVINQNNSLQLNVSHDDNVVLLFNEYDDYLVRELAKVVDLGIAR